VIVAVDLEQLAELARLEAERHPARTPERRAAAALWVSLITTKTVDSARSALVFAPLEVQADALRLLGQLAVREHENQPPAVA
jgi:hypothetical protein